MTFDDLLPRGSSAALPDITGESAFDEHSDLAGAGRLLTTVLDAFAAPAAVLELETAGAVVAAHLSDPGVHVAEERSPAHWSGSR